MLADAGATCTEATGTIITVIAAVAFLPSVVAVIVAEPWVTPATRPLLLAVATPVLLLVHVTGRPVSGLPAESAGVAGSCSRFPMNTFAGVGPGCREANGTLGTLTGPAPHRD